MPHSRDHSEPTRSLGKLLSKLFVNDEPTDESAIAALDHIDRLQERIDSVRGEVKRGIRKPDNRFRL